MVFFYLASFIIYSQYFFKTSIFIKCISAIFLIKILIFIRNNTKLFKNIRAPPSSFVSKEIKTGGKNK